VKIALNKLHFPVTTLGYGRRVGIWFQGCSIRCPGCISQDTWESNPRFELDVDGVMEKLTSWLAEADGVTISGGEPFDQPEALHALCGQLRASFNGDLLVYSGYPQARLQEKHGGVLSGIDVLISEPYREAQPQTLWLRGSDNQRLHLLTPLARKRYGANADRKPWPPDRSLDVMAGDDLWLAGIPEPGTLERFQAALARRGYGMSGTSQATAGLVRA